MRELERMTATDLHTLATHLHCRLIVLKHDREDFQMRLDNYDAAVKNGSVSGTRRGMYKHRIGLLKDTILLQDEAIKSARDLMDKIEKRLYQLGDLDYRQFERIYTRTLNG